MWSHGARFLEIQAEKERRKKEKSAKLKEKEDRKDAKRRRISRENEEDDDTILQSREAEPSYRWDILRSFVNPST
jgi:hypothetical protein